MAVGSTKTVVEGVPAKSRGRWAGILLGFLAAFGLMFALDSLEDGMRLRGMRIRIAGSDLTAAGAGGLSLRLADVDWRLSCNGACDEVVYTTLASPDIRGLTVRDRRGGCLICRFSTGVFGMADDSWRVAGAPKLSVLRMPTLRPGDIKPRAEDWEEGPLE